MNDITIDQRERLRKIRGHRHFTGTDRFPSRTAEGGQEVVGGAAIGNLHRAGTQGQSLEFFTTFGGLANHIQHHFRPHTSDGGMAEVAIVRRVGLVRFRSQLIGARRADIADEALEVVVVAGELLAERIKQFGVDGGVADTHIINRFNDPITQKVRPDHVGEILGEIGILRRSQPFGEHFTAILSLHIRDLSSQKFRDYFATGNRVGHITATAVTDDDFSRVFPLLTTNLCEEIGEAVVVILGPAVERVIVTLGALNTHAHEDLGRVLRNFESIAFDVVVVGLRAFERSTTGSKQLLDDLIERNVAGDFVFQPFVVAKGGLVAESLIVVRANLQQLGPFHHPHLHEFLTTEQFVNELFPFFRVGGLHEFLVIGGGGQQADDVEVGTAEKDLIAAER